MSPLDSACPGAPTLLAYAEGRLSGTRREDAEVHLDACASCLAAVAELGRGAASTPRAESASDDIGGAARYELGAEIARGGMGRILRAWDRKLGRDVAIKTVARDRSSSLIARLEREMALTARLQHPAIVPIYDAGRLDDGEPYYAMRWIDGQTLRHAIDACDSTHERLALLPIVLALAEAIAYAHGQSIVHRDIKPSNVVVGTFGETVVLDWGLAKDLNDSTDAILEGAGSQPESGEAMTADGQVMGTPGYIAPEQTRGEPADTRADVYAVGIVLLELATGKIPRHGAVEVLYPQLGEAVPPDLGTIIRRATAQDPAVRYPDGGALVAELRRYAQGRLVLSHEYTAVQRIRRFVARHRGAVAVALVFVLALTVGGTWAVANVVAERDAATQARTVAQTERGRAEQRRDAAQALVQFVVSDLGVALESIGRSDLLAKVARRVLDYFEDVAPLDATADPTDLVQQAETLHALGSSLGAASDFVGARRAYEDGLARAEAAHARGTPGARWWVVSHRERLGYVASVEGDVAGARARLVEVVAEVRAAMPEAAEPAKWAELAGPAFIALYTLDEQVGEHDKAVGWLDAAQAMVAQPHGPADLWAETNADLELAVAQYRGRLARAQGDLAGYRAAADVMVAAARGKYEASEERVSAGGNYVAALMERASAYELTGDAATAHADLKLALPIATDTAQRDPTNILHQATLGTTLQFLAKNAREREMADEASAYFGQAEDVAAHIRRLAPDDVNQLRTQAASASKYRCLVDIERAAYEDARAACARSLDALARAYAIQPDHPARERDVESVTVLAAQAALGLGDLGPARTHAQEALTLARAFAAAGEAPRDRLALVEALATVAMVAYDEGRVADQHGAAVEARRVLDELKAPHDPLKARALADQLAQLLPPR